MADDKEQAAGGVGGGAMTPLDPASFPKTRDALEGLRTNLNAAFASALAKGNAPGASDAAEATDKVLDHVEAMLIVLDREAAEARDGSMQAATAEVKAPLERLIALRGEIEQVDKAVKLFGNVVSGMNTAASLWKSCFSL